VNQVFPEYPVKMVVLESLVIQEWWETKHKKEIKVYFS
jgi:hypothetical protein